MLHSIQKKISLEVSENGSVTRYAVDHYGTYLIEKYISRPKNVDLCKKNAGSILWHSTLLPRQGHAIAVVDLVVSSTEEEE